MRKFEKNECSGCEFQQAEPLPWAPDEYVKYCTWGKAKRRKRLHKPNIWRTCKLINKDGY